ncbi:MAG: hypothetical protein ACTSO2_13765 [Promethearchaeota archaeon]
MQVLDKDFDMIINKIKKINKKTKVLKLDMDFEKEYMSIDIKITNLRKLYKILDKLGGDNYRGF